MISPFTKPGEKIVCVDADIGGKYTCGYKTDGDLDGLTEGMTYTVREIAPSVYSSSGFCVCVEEIERRIRVNYPCCGFALERFRYLHLPRSLTDLLETAPTRAPSELEPTQ